MEIAEVTYKEYSNVISMPYHAFGTVEFNLLNKNKCDELYFILFKESKYRLGIIGGTIDKVFYSPFSAPYGGFSYISPDVRLKYIEEAIRQLIIWATKKGLLSISITLPPSFYEDSFTAKEINCLWRAGFKISKIELNHSFFLGHLDDNYTNRIWYNARKNLTIAMKVGLQFSKCETIDEKRLAYDIISGNRLSRGNPLHLTWQQINDTINIIRADFFLVKLDKSTPIASALVFHITENIVQIIYWGDLQGFAEFKPMNFISFKIFEYYKRSSMRIVDIGYSTVNSVPNYGLSEFKESLGCDVHPKYSFEKNLY